VISSSQRPLPDNTQKWQHHFLNDSFYCTISLLQTIITKYVVSLKFYTIYYMSCRVIFQWIFSNHIFSYLWNGIYENLVVKSVGLNLFNFLGSSPSSVDASSFGCVVILSLYSMLNFVISSLTVSILESVCRSLFGIYRGAFTIVRRTLFWYLCNSSMFELLAVPQRGITYVQMGFRIVLYISNLFSIDNSDFLPRIHHICWNFNTSFFYFSKYVCLPRQSSVEIDT
jgi:hypothetical protein